MARALVECVPNFSEGRDPADRGRASSARLRRRAGVVVLGHESDVDHNRSVVTFAGAPQAVADSRDLRGIAKAVELIDFSKHTGVHPRIGAADVVPFVPVEGVTLDECARLAEEIGEEVWRRLRVPVYLYEAAARCENRRRLENVRRGGFAWLRRSRRRAPAGYRRRRAASDRGCAVIGARKFLVAFNINLTTRDVEIARSIARSVRESSGGLTSVKAIGVPLESRGLAQVSMNLTDFETDRPGPGFDCRARRGGTARCRHRNQPRSSAWCRGAR